MAFQASACTVVVWTEPWRPFAGHLLVLAKFLIVSKAVQFLPSLVFSADSRRCEWMIQRGKGQALGPNTDLVGLKYYRLVSEMPPQVFGLWWYSTTEFIKFRVHIDDAGIFSNSTEKRIIHQNSVFQRLKSCSLKVRLPKCYSAQTKILFLGHVINAGGVVIDSNKIVASPDVMAYRKIA